MNQRQEGLNLKEGRLHDFALQIKKVLLIGVFFSSKGKIECEDNLEELKKLAETFGIKNFELALVGLRHIQVATFIGNGKAKELAEKCKNEKIDLIIFDDEIAPQQQKNLEEIFSLPIIDRTELILGVFAQRAQTREAKIQIELAQVQYQIPRLTRLWTHLERQKVGGGSGGYLKGAGERQIEIDRRLLRKRMSKLESELLEVKKNREAQRKARLRASIPSFAIVGYTNVGKSTLLKALTDAEVLVEDKLFATLDTTTRKFILPNKQEILLIDTVGFIRKIPHTLVAAFRSTLEEAVFTDILLHLVDVSHPLAEKQAEASFAVLTELKATEKPIITVLNKIDQIHDEQMVHRLQLKYPKTVKISATKKEGFSELLEMMMKEISAIRKIVKLKIPQSHYRFVSELMGQAKILSLEYEGNDICISAEIPTHLEHKVEPFLKSN